MAFSFAIIIGIIGLLALIIAKYIAYVVNKAPAGNEKITEIGDAIHEGAMAYLKRQYMVTGWFILVMGIVIFFFFFS